MMSINLSDIVILNIKGSDYCCIISLISKNETINLMENADLTKGKLIKHKKIIFILGKKILTFGDIEIAKTEFYHNKT